MSFWTDIKVGILSFINDYLNLENIIIFLLGCTITYFWIKLWNRFCYQPLSPYEEACCKCIQENQMMLGGCIVCILTPFAIFIEWLSLKCDIMGTSCLHCTQYMCCKIKKKDNISPEDNNV